MSKILLLSTILMFCINSYTFSQSNSTKVLMGSWEGIDKNTGKVGKFVFIDSIQIEVVYPDGSKNNCVYTIDFKKNPAWFDIINSQLGRTKTLKGLIKILNDSTFNWYLSSDGNRPVDYSHLIMTFRKKS